MSLEKFPLVHSGIIPPNMRNMNIPNYVQVKPTILLPTENLFHDFIPFQKLKGAWIAVRSKEQTFSVPMDLRGMYSTELAIATGATLGVLAGMKNMLKGKGVTKLLTTPMKTAVVTGALCYVGAKCVDEMMLGRK